MGWRPSSSARPQTEDTRLLCLFNTSLQCKHTWKSSWDIFLLTENPAELKNSVPPGRERSNSPVAYCRVNSSFWKWPSPVITGPLQSMKYSLTIPAEAQKRRAYLRIWSGVRRKKQKTKKRDGVVASDAGWQSQGVWPPEWMGLLVAPLVPQLLHFLVNQHEHTQGSSS